MKAVFHTEDLNSYGFWILLSGMDLNRYKKNPVLLYDHNGRTLSVGKVNNLKSENGKLTGDVEFDEEDELGKELKRKYEKGYMSGFSIGFRPIEFSDDKKLLKKGQRLSTVSKSELYEISAVNIPSNANAIKLYDAEGVQLNANGNLPEEFKRKLNINETEMKQIAITLGLPDDASEKQILDAIAKLKADAQQVKTLKTDMTEMVLSMGKEKGVVNEQNEAAYRDLAETNPTAVLTMINTTGTQKNEKPQEQDVKLSDLINEKSRPETKNKKWEELSESELIELREKNLKEYKRLYAEYYGKEPVIG